MAKAQPSQRESSIELLLRHFSSKLTDSAASLPSTRCIARKELTHVLSAIRDELALPEFRSASVSSLLAILERSGLIRSIEIIPLSGRVRKDRFYAVGLDADPALMDPAELLQAHVPGGVVCYFTALQLHELTTQPATHHHIAKLRPLGDGAALRPEIMPSATVAPPLGSAQFEYQNVPYYLSIRDTSILRKYQQRFLNARSRVRVTTLEQTLIDTLHRPMNAGGPSVVFEAWEAAAARLNDATLVDLLFQIKQPLIARRVGYMLERALGSPSPASTDLKKIVSEQMAGDTGEPSSLIAFMPYKTYDARWHLLVP
jgi:predicted transcriptional regulator of viral defense system